jgi:hypothetical protein
VCVLADPCRSILSLSPFLRGLPLMRHAKQYDAKVFLLAARFLIGGPQVLNIRSAKAPPLRSKEAFFVFLIPGGRKRKRNAERRRLLNRRNRRCGTRLAGRARLPAFHRGSRQWDIAVPKALPQATLPGTWPSAGVTRGVPVPVQ